MTGVDNSRTRLKTPPVLNLDPFSEASLRDPLEFQRVLRAGGPVVYLPAHQCYAVGRYAEVFAAFGDWKNFSSSAGTGLSHTRKGETIRPPGPIVEVDPPQHTKIRQLMNRILSPSVIRKWREDFEAEAERLVSSVVARGRFDGMADIAEPFVLSVFPDALGIDKDGRENLLAIGDLTGNALGPANALYLDSARKVDPIMPWFNAKFERQAMLPGGFGETIWAHADQGDLEMDLVAPLLRTFLRGGTDTVISSIGSMLWLLASNPDQWALLKAEPKLVRGAFEEALRLETPAQTLFRTTNGSVEFFGYSLNAETKVLCSLAAANRDPAKWPDPDRYDIRRSTFRHMALGTGVHVCLGQMIARLEGEAILSALLRRVSRLELDGEISHRLSNSARRIEALPLRVRVEAG
ncbi:cytochrome P450 [Sphingomonas sp. SRS2]|uniref:cytochrome P450 n=1 Tax=Sphingomonas sp. SRS2 TaxID=133190 RepID=UPI0006184527|nr:cytochrome P450 [Sphingomonas sp. SRS2]KKC24036.1 hypothetical protein WP12_21610 [Sphingomonas sp. SRS2]